MSRKIIYVLLLFTMLPVLIFAGDGRIKGKVTDLSTGEALVGANVIVVGSSFGAATDVNGDFVIMNLDAGQYTVKASYLGYQSITITNVRVSLDLTTEVDFQLPDLHDCYSLLTEGPTESRKGAVRMVPPTRTWTQMR